MTPPPTFDYCLFDTDTMSTNLAASRPVGWVRECQPGRFRHPASPPSCLYSSLDHQQFLICAYQPNLMSMNNQPATMNRRTVKSRKRESNLHRHHNCVAEMRSWIQLKERARNLNANDLEKKIEVEMRVREAAFNMMEHLLTDHSQPSAEAAKVSEQKMLAYKQELDTRTVIPGSCRSEKEPSKARLGISEMRFPLMWRERDHFKNRGDSRQFAMFAVFRVGADICDSALIYGIDRTCTDVAFSDILIFDNVMPGFQVHVTLYSALLDPTKIVSGSTSLRIRNRLKGSLTRSLGAKWGSLAKKQLENPVGNNQENGLQFSPIATAVLSIREAGDFARTHDFTIHPFDDQSCPPLYGHFCCRLVVQPSSTVESQMEGDLNIQIKDRKFMNLWCRAREGKLSCWRYQQELLALPPIIDIPISQDCIMQIGRRGDCLILSVPIMAGYAQYVISFEHGSDLLRWKEALETLIFDCKFWGPFASKAVLLGHENQQSEKPYYLRPNCRNLYDEISLTGDEIIPMETNSNSKFYKRPSVRNFFAGSSSNRKDENKLNAVPEKSKLKKGVSCPPPVNVEQYVIQDEQIAPSEKGNIQKPPKIECTQ